jgi:hypothetical protein
MTHHRNAEYVGRMVNSHGAPLEQKLVLRIEEIEPHGAVTLAQAMNLCP